MNLDLLIKTRVSFNRVLFWKIKGCYLHKEALFGSLAERGTIYRVPHWTFNDFSRMESIMSKLFHNLKKGLNYDKNQMALPSLKRSEVEAFLKEEQF